MLVQKKIKKSKLFIYLVITILMLTGIGFFIYKNRTLNFYKKALVVDITVSTTSAEDSIEDLMKEKEDQSDPGATGAWEEEEEIQATTEAVPGNKSLVERLINLDLFKSSNYKRLEEYDTKTPDFKVGNKNLFKPIK